MSNTLLCPPANTPTQKRTFFVLRAANRNTEWAQGVKSGPLMGTFFSRLCHPRYASTYTVTEKVIRFPCATTAANPGCSDTHTHNFNIALPPPPTHRVAGRQGETIPRDDRQRRRRLVVRHKAQGASIPRAVGRPVGQMCSRAASKHPLCAKHHTGSPTAAEAMTSTTVSGGAGA
jgi:hypothetical protein